MKDKSSIISILSSFIDRSLVINIIRRYEKMVTEFLLGNYENVLVQCGKFVELFYQILEFIAFKKYSNKPNLPNIRKKLSEAAQNQIIPSHLNSLISDSLHIGYRFRNSRDGAHTTDFIANKIDSKYIINISKWCLSELIRTYSDLKISDCVKLTDNLMAEPEPIIQNFGEDILVLHSTSAFNELLITLFYSENKTCDLNVLKDSLKHHSKSNISTSLRNLEKKRYIYRKNSIVFISRAGEKYIQELFEMLNN